MFARLSALSNQTLIERNSTLVEGTDSRPTIQSMSEDSVFMPPPGCQSSMIKAKGRKRKCQKNIIESKSNDSSTFNTSSFIRNSREKSYVDESNIQRGKRQRKKKD